MFRRLLCIIYLLELMLHIITRNSILSFSLLHLSIGSSSPVARLQSPVTSHHSQLASSKFSFTSHESESRQWKQLTVTNGQTQRKTATPRQSQQATMIWWGQQRSHNGEEQPLCSSIGPPPLSVIKISTKQTISVCSVVSHSIASLLIDKATRSTWSLVVIQPQQ